MDTGLRGKVVLVTGAAAGIGRATALRFAGEGCKVAGFDVNEAAGPGLVAEIGKAGGEGLFVRVNVAEAASVEAGVGAVLERWGRVDVLVNNAGILRDAQLVKWKDGARRGDDDRRGVGRGARREPQGRLPLHAGRGPAHDPRGRRRRAQRLVGGGALRELRPDELRGHEGRRRRDDPHLGPRAGQAQDPRERGGPRLRGHRDPPRRCRRRSSTRWSSTRRSGGMGRPEDVANAYCWLASDQASFVTGHCLSVDGGVVVGT